MATGYDGQGNEALMYDLGWLAPAGQMYSTLNDLMKVYNYVYMFAYLDDRSQENSQLQVETILLC